jgi:hypothetical protein
MKQYLRRYDRGKIFIIIWRRWLYWVLRACIQSLTHGTNKK